MTLDEFIASEIATWGQDYIFDLVDRGYEAKRLIDSHGEVRFTWVLTQAPIYASISVGSDPVFTPVSQVSRL